MAGVGRRLERLEGSSRRSAAAEIRRAWLEMGEEGMVLVLGPYYFGREPTAEEKAALEKARELMPEDLIARALGYREGMGNEELGRRIGDLVEPVLEVLRRPVLRRLRRRRSAGEGGQAS